MAQRRTNGPRRNGALPKGCGGDPPATRLVHRLSAEDWQAEDRHPSGEEPLIHRAEIARCGDSLNMHLVYAVAVAQRFRLVAHSAVAY